MFYLISKPSIWLAAALSVCFIATNTALAHDGDKKRAKTVNCYEGNASVQSKIDKVKAGRDTTIFIVGFCDERVTITKDGITLSGNKNGWDTIDNGLTEVTVTGAQRVQIEYLKITGAGSGVIVRHGATATIIGNNIYANTDAGVEVNYGSSAVLNDNIITGNGETGIFVGHGSQARLRGGNTVSSNTGEEIFVSQVSSFRAGVSPYTGVKDIFTENEFELAAIHVKENSNVDIRNTDIICILPCTNAIETVDTATFRAQNNTSITGNIFAFHAGVRVRRPTEFFGTLNCGDGAYTYGHVFCGQTCNGDVTGSGMCE
jgi:hypothetical protein